MKICGNCVRWRGWISTEIGGFPTMGECVEHNRASGRGFSCADFEPASEIPEEELLKMAEQNEPTPEPLVTEVTKLRAELAAQMRQNAEARKLELSLREIIKQERGDAERYKSLLIENGFPPREGVDGVAYETRPEWNTAGELRKKLEFRARQLKTARRKLEEAKKLLKSDRSRLLDYIQGLRDKTTKKLDEAASRLDGAGDTIARGADHGCYSLDELEKYEKERL